MELPISKSVRRLVRHFIKSLKNRPIELADVETLLNQLTLQVGEETDDLIISYLSNLSSDFKQAVVDLLKQIQGKQELKRVKNKFEKLYPENNKKKHSNWS